MYDKSFSGVDVGVMKHRGLGGAATGSSDGFVFCLRKVQSTGANCGCGSYGVGMESWPHEWTALLAGHELVMFFYCVGHHRAYKLPLRYFFAN